MKKWAYLTGKTIVVGVASKFLICSGEFFQFKRKGIGSERGRVAQRWQPQFAPRKRNGYFSQVDHVLVQDALDVGGVDFLRQIVRFSRQRKLSVQQTYGKESDVVNIAPAFDAKQPARVLVGSGIGVGFHRRLPEGASFVYIMVIRDPFRWALSAYLREVHHDAGKRDAITGNVISSMLPWYENQLRLCPLMRLETDRCLPCEPSSMLHYWARRLPPSFNGSDVQTGILRHLDHFTLIFLYERYYESLEMLAAFFRVPYDAAVQDVWKGVSKMPTNESLGQHNIGQLIGNATIADLMDFNKLLANTLSADMYSIARRRFEADYFRFHSRRVANWSLPLRVCRHHTCPSLRKCNDITKLASIDNSVKLPQQFVSVRDVGLVDHVLIYHFPKTGGMSLIDFVKALAHSRRLTLQHAYKSDDCNYKTSRRPCQLEGHGMQGFSPTRPARVIIGHNVTYAFARDFLPSSSTYVFITFFREPLDWAISRYFYFRDPYKEASKPDGMMDRISKHFDTFKNCPRMLYFFFDCHCQRISHFSQWALFAPESFGNATGILRQLGYVSLALLTDRYVDSLKLLASAFKADFESMRVPEIQVKNTGKARASVNTLPLPIVDHLRFERFSADRTRMGDVYRAARNKFRIDYATWLKEGSVPMRVLTPSEVEYAGACFERR